MNQSTQTSGLAAHDCELEALRKSRMPTEAERLAADKLLDRMKSDGTLDAQRVVRELREQNRGLA